MTTATDTSLFEDIRKDIAELAAQTANSYPSNLPLAALKEVEKVINETFNDAVGLAMTHIKVACENAKNPRTAVLSLYLAGMVITSKFSHISQQMSVLLPVAEMLVARGLTVLNSEIGKAYWEEDTLGTMPNVSAISALTKDGLSEILGLLRAYGTDRAHLAAKSLQFSTSGTCILCEKQHVEVACG